MKLQRKSGLRMVAVGSAVVSVSGALLLTACGSSDSSRPSGSSPVAASPATTAGAGGVKCGKAATVSASGSTAQEFAMQFWIKNFMRACPGTRISYEGNGSGAGQTDFLKGRTAFAGSDSALSATQITQSKSVCSNDGRAVHLPMLGGPIAIAYNLPGVSKLVLDAPTLAKVFDAQITKWNDPAIAKLNPGAKLPSTPIQASHRSDSSGTTDNLTSYLSAAAPSAWSYGHSKEWMAKGGRSAKGSSGIAEQVKKTVGAIGYVELSYAIARNIPTVAIATGAPAPVDASVLTASKALADAKIAGADDDLVLKLDYATKAPGAYPIDLVTYEIVCDKGNRPATWSTTKAFLTYIAGPEGQEDLSFQGYATLPATIVNKVRSKINNLS
ncbi:phosphate ABC transporter substrate-binding protein PstS [Streptomyces sp. DG2A-72]|uniref:phosphate ABC transporter substrate-binding protein PstS n=1 Tax=Streptomyces sp. DG2A-72 TaxID=3051386 RepID=UPI00265C7A7E|nr:phosphate ABC transporter substrate-binding protein PstS [Streptomyces sp. DG2A-72]MDO0930304.1 phosphate ABC transporter substrate-binding protein PstS [Streptomyces sp. DG2A-72]